MQIERIYQATEAAGLTPRGGFHPESEDVVPDVAEGRPAQTLLLFGNAGPQMWQRFSEDRNPETDLLDDWSREKLGSVARDFGAKALFPFTKPHLPFQRWAQRAEACFASPLGIFIHPDYGLWHGYRGALACAERLDLPPQNERPSPCESCPDKPCLTTCPVSAFTEGAYDVRSCVRHIASPEGADCMAQGCRARRACPEGRDFVYRPEQAAFHMRAFLRARRADGVV